MRKHILLMVGLAIVTLAQAACGSNANSSAPNSQPATTQASSDTSTGGGLVQGTIGDTLTVEGWDHVVKAEVTLKDTQRISEAENDGYEIHPALFGVLVTVRNAGEGLYDDNSVRSFVLIDDQDVSRNAGYYSDELGDLFDPLEEWRIGPGDQRTGWVYFELKPQRKPRLVQFTADSGNEGPDMNVGEWSLQ